MADLGLLNPVAVQDLADRLAAAELRATQQQQEVVKVGADVVGTWMDSVGRPEECTCLVCEQVCRCAWQDVLGACAKLTVISSFI